MLVVVLIAIIYTCADVTCFIAIPPISFTRPVPPPPSESPNDGRIGQWDPWGNWSPCSKPCDGGVRERSRKCKSGPDDCPGGAKAAVQKENCNNFPCCSKKPILHEWTKWNRCPVTCGEGIIFRVRRCEFFDCFEGPSLCNAPLQETKICDAGCCPVETKWGDWSDWSECICVGRKSEKKRTRECIIHDCEKSPKMCIGDAEETKQCRKKCKSPKPTWSNWSDWSDCSVTCGKGKKTRERTCDASGNKKKCKGKSSEEMECDAGCCEESFWGDWDEWSQCTVTCGGGTQERNRVCNKPCEDSGPCRGDDRQTRTCNEQDCCTGDSEWQAWSNWSECSATCDGGAQERTRECFKPCPNSGPCSGGSNRETRSCNEQSCEEECKGKSKWTNWESWSSCTATCGEGQQERTRECNKPCPDSKPCKRGSPTDSKSCNLQECCVGESVWMDWKAWSECSATCGGGSQERTRECDRPCPDSGPCEGGSNTDSKQCNTQDCCTGESVWMDWKPWSECSVTCGGGSQERTRECDRPCPDSGPCEGGSDTETQKCNEQSCEKECQGTSEWEDWSQWSECTVTCGAGTKDRRRRCNKPCEDSKSCTGPDFQSSVCIEQDCDDGKDPCKGRKGQKSDWKNWGEWSPCSVSCGPGMSIRERECHKPCPKSKDCKGSHKEDKECNLMNCDGTNVCEDGVWGPWKTAPCSVTCGEGRKIKTRECIKTCPEGKPCKGISEDFSYCNEACCPVPSQWSEWSDWSPCCEKQQQRTRTCEAQPPCKERVPKCMLDGVLTEENHVESASCPKNKRCK